MHTLDTIMSTILLRIRSVQSFLVHNLARIVFRSLAVEFTLCRDDVYYVQKYETIHE